MDYLYGWVDGVHVNVRLCDRDQLGLLMMTGDRPVETKELIAVDDGFRESTESWAALLRDRSVEGCGPYSSPWGKGLRASGRQCGTSGPRPGNKGTGCPGSEMSWKSCRCGSRCLGKNFCARSCTPPRKIMLSRV